MSEKCNHTIGYRVGHAGIIHAVSIEARQKYGKDWAVRLVHYCPECGDKIYKGSGLKVGDIVEIPVGARVIAKIPADLLAGLKTSGDYRLVEKDLVAKNRFEYLAGIYEVINIAQLAYGDLLTCRLQERTIRSNRSDDGFVGVMATEVKKKVEPIDMGEYIIS